MPRRFDSGPVACLPKNREREQIMIRYLVWMIALLAAATVPLLAQEAAPKPDPLVPLRFFVGAWRGDQKGEPGRGFPSELMGLSSTIVSFK